MSDLHGLLQPAVEDMGYVFWGMEQLRQGRGSLLRIYIDSPSGVALDDCAAVSERLAGILDVEDPITGAYRLEVSSPGLDRRLFTVAQYRQAVGAMVSVRLRRLLDKRRRITGLLRGADARAIVLEDAGVEIQILMDDIDTTRIAPEEC